MAKNLKVKMLSRDPNQYLRETKKDIHKLPRNYDPDLHPFAAQREYIRALNSSKLEKVFSKPFVGSLDGHTDGIFAMEKHPQSLSRLVTGSYNGEVKMWDLMSKKCLQSVTAHIGYVRAIAYHPNGTHFYTCGNDAVIRCWKSDIYSDEAFNQEPSASIISKTRTYYMAHHQKEGLYATCGENVQLWKEERQAPIRTYNWGVDSVHCVKFNPIDTHLLGSLASDRSVMIYDIRERLPMRKVVMKMNNNAMSWNPMEAYTFVVANEDYDAYVFDMRNLKSPVSNHRGHISAVTDVDYSPTGKEFVTSSVDKTIRLFDQDSIWARETYFTKRMQGVNCVKWSLDNRFILSCSDEMNVRIWKANPSEVIGTTHYRMKSAMNYNKALKEKFFKFPKVHRIATHRHVPEVVFKASKNFAGIRANTKAKEDRYKSAILKKGAKRKGRQRILDRVVIEEKE